MRWLHALVILGMLLSGWLPVTANAWAEPDMMEAPRQARGVASLSPRPAVATTGTSDTLLALSLEGPREIAQGEPLSLTLEAWNVGQTRIDGAEVRVTAEDETHHARSITVDIAIPGSGWADKPLGENYQINDARTLAGARGGG